jgi:hypothetical protein
MTLSDGTTTLTLRADMQWPEHYRVARARSEHLCFGGQLVTQESAVQVVAGTDHIVGEPITLTATQRYAWVSGEVPDGAARSPAAQLRLWAITPGQTLTLADLRGLPDLTVSMRGLELAPIRPDADTLPGRWYIGSIALTVLGAAA